MRFHIYLNPSNITNTCSFPTVQSAFIIMRYYMLLCGLVQRWWDPIPCYKVSFHKVSGKPLARSNTAKSTASAALINDRAGCVCVCGLLKRKPTTDWDPAPFISNKDIVDAWCSWWCRVGPTLSGDVISHTGVVLWNVIAHIADIWLIVWALRGEKVQSGVSQRVPHKLWWGQQAVVAVCQRLTNCSSRRLSVPLQ